MLHVINNSPLGKLYKENPFCCGAERYFYSVYVYLDDKMLFGAIDKKQILLQGDRLYIYEFER